MEEVQREEAVARVEAAAAAGDAWGTVEALLGSPILDGLVRQLRSKWPSLPHADVDEAVSQAVDELHAAIRKGTPVTNPVAWLFKVADRKAWRLHARHIDEQLRDPGELDAMGAPMAEEEEPEATTQEVVAVARHLLGQFPQGGHTVAVMKVYIDAAELGISHLETREVADIVGLNPASVRVLRARGFQRLERLARDAGLVSPTFDLGELLEDGGDGDQGGDDDTEDDERRL